MTTTTSTTFYGRLHGQDVSAGAGPIQLSISFQGSAPRGLSDIDIPFELCFKVPQEFSSLRPLIQATARHAQPMRRRESIGGRVQDDLHIDRRPQQPRRTSISFLPLPSTFDVSSARAWASLASQIQDWLITSVGNHLSPYWSWGVEAFWVAFVAAYPSFPLGDWPRWDTRIPLRGAFIETRVTGVASLDGEVVEGGDAAVDDADSVQRSDQRCRLALWQQFQEVISILYPFPLIISVADDPRN
ncbi:hypothetical protein EW146_g1396 [Bondarzewia mesenterica]|uniref:Uncharacterized protein n=1 Tax=Bondarzewia mesenterica TaxID=1095465 RepID=A0A4S4M5W5_9AGAM|nr:hypothetical protein EW146_g1396 [Bondarzewia mesenterica]